MMRYVVAAYHRYVVEGFSTYIVILLDRTGLYTCTCIYILLITIYGNNSNYVYK